MEIRSQVRQGAPDLRDAVSGVIQGVTSRCPCTMVSPIGHVGARALLSYVELERELGERRREDQPSQEPRRVIALPRVQLTETVAALSEQEREAFRPSLGATHGRFPSATICWGGTGGGTRARGEGTARGPEQQPLHLRSGAGGRRDRGDAGTTRCRFSVPRSIRCSSRAGAAA